MLKNIFKKKQYKLLIVSTLLIKTFDHDHVIGGEE